MIRNFIKWLLGLLGIKEKDQDKYARVKGEEGENRVAQLFKDVLVLQNLYIPTYYGYTEVDIILITPQGLFVTEVKNYNNCRVTGGLEDNDWEVEYRSGKRYTMYNPIKQNLGHIKAISSLFQGQIDRVIYSLIIFSDNVEIGVKSKEIKQEKDIPLLIQRMRTGKPVLRENQMIKIFKELKNYTNPPEYVKTQHKRNVKAYKKGLHYRQK